jgi:hypothetical protein
MFDPECRVKYRVILLSGPDLKPDSGNAVGGLEFWPCNMEIVIEH